MSRFPWEWQYVWAALPHLIAGLKLTVAATIAGSALTFVLGLVWFMLRLANLPLISPVANFVVQFVRGTPLLIQLYFVFYVLPTVQVTLSPMVCGIIGLAIFNSAPTSEVYRAGIEAIPKGQWEACPDARNSDRPRVVADHSAPGVAHRASDDGQRHDPDVQGNRVALDDHDRRAHDAGGRILVVTLSLRRTLDDGGGVLLRPQLPLVSWREAIGTSNLV